MHLYDFMAFLFLAMELTCGLKQLSGLVVECQPAALKVLASNPEREAQKFSKLTFISRNSEACQLHVT